MIYSASYSDLRLYKDAVSVSLFPPTWRMPIYKELAPTFKIQNWWDSFTTEQKKDEKIQSIYVRLYLRDVLNRLDPEKVAKDLDGKTIVSEEKNGEFSHRLIVERWLIKHGFECKEVDINDA